jgi:HEPN domain-containing protein
MSGGADPRSLAGVWLQKASGDLAAAQALLQPSIPPWTAAFHAQQCVEKCLKAVLVALDRPFPKSHDSSEAGGRKQAYRRRRRFSARWAAITWSTK